MDNDKYECGWISDNSRVILYWSEICQSFCHSMLCVPMLYGLYGYIDSCTDGKVTKVSNSIKYYPKLSSNIGWFNRWSFVTEVNLKIIFRISRPISTHHNSPDLTPHLWAYDSHPDINYPFQIQINSPWKLKKGH